ncbi:HhH-GPD base excision DNA repair family protein [Medicago truncatula]|uniref:HhH-GPD base excision DNA repair family protein n=2 Tax=Medicago truncatula TaxID=3880 RepID=G7KEG3_MEDTR|nr:HhH-GPD base excision DNA repair family protein [Medicago truncatula]
MHRKKNKRDVRKKSGELVLYNRPSAEVEVMLDEETLRVWNLLVVENKHEENDEHKRRYWEMIRKLYHKMVISFLDQVHTVQGDRRFLPWKGSVLDSVGGVFLTQNVSDHLSSSAFMSLAARFPVKLVSGEQSKNMVLSDKKMEAQKANESFIERNSNSPPSRRKQTDNKKKSKKQEEKEMLEKKILEKKMQHWETLRKIHSKSDQHIDHADSVDWEAVRDANVNEVAAAIKKRGQQNIIAYKIQVALKGFMVNHGSMNLEWLKDIPPNEAKEYFLSIFGLGLKSVECLRLLTLQHISFPVDVNVGRIVVRLGWVPLQPLPESIQIHNLEKFPDPIKIQQYLWPRLCKLDHQTLYELHYQLITFGKVFCTKRNPNCNACPMKDGCKYYASSLARTKLALPPKSTTDQSIVATQMDHCFPYSDYWSNSTSTLFTKESKECEPIVEMPASPELIDDDEEIYHDYTYESDEEDIESDEEDIESDEEDIEDIPTFNISSQESSSCLPMYGNSFEEFDHGVNASQSLVAFHPNATNSHLSKMKNASRLKTERTVYVLTDNHPLLAEYPSREHDDPSPYLLVVWRPAELESSGESSKTDLHEEESSQTETVPGTLLIPCRTAMRARFPLNGTYFQVNEVFADYASMKKPIHVPRKWIWSLKKQIAYFGTGASSMTRGLSMEEIKDFFCKGFICVRAIDTNTGAPRPISSILHRNTTLRVRKTNKM